jgi:hypothetical protein
VVLGGVAVRAAVLIGGEELLFAVLRLLFQPAKIRKPISSSSETPAIKPHMPPTFALGGKADMRFCTAYVRL